MGWGRLTGLAILLVLAVQASHTLHQLPLFTAAGVVDEVAGQYLLELPHRQALHLIEAGEVRERCTSTLLCRGAGLP